MKQIYIALEEDKELLPIRGIRIIFTSDYRPLSDPISIRPKKLISYPIYRNKNWLYNEYGNLKKSEVQIAREQDISRGAIRYQIKKFDIKKRPIGETIHLAVGHHVNFSPKAIEFIEGELLGDGHLHLNSKWSAKYQHESKYKEYINWLSNQLNSFGIKQSGIIRKRVKKFPGWNTTVTSYAYESASYSDLLPLWQKWYRLYNPKTDPSNWRYKYIKIIPRDLELTSLQCRQWYLGDGTMKYFKKSRSAITLYTQGFSIADISFLVEKLNKLGFKAKRHPSNNTIYISVKSASAFLNHIGSCPIDCYKYKWKLRDNRKKKR